MKYSMIFLIIQFESRSRQFRQQASNKQHAQHIPAQQAQQS
jgi:hypothetical protein